MIEGQDGFGVTRHPVADAVIETAYGVLCWQLFGGSWALLGDIPLLNALDLPFMFAKSNAASQIARQPAVLTTVVPVQILLSWIVVWIFARKRGMQLGPVRK